MTRTRSRSAADVLWIVLLALWCASSFWLSSKSDPETYVGVHVEMPDELKHGIQYAAGGFLAAGVMQRLRRMPPWIAAVIFCGIWGVLDEVHQSFVPGRDATGTDVAADLVGATFGALVFVFGFGRRQPSRPRDDESPGLS